MIGPLPRVLYNLVLTGSWPLLALYYGLRIKTDGKYRFSYRARLGLELPEPPARPGAIWIHALSLGETLSALPLLNEFRRVLPQRPLVLSTATESGARIGLARAAGLCQRRFVLAHDLFWTMTRLVERLRPALFVLVETDLWPNLLHILKRCGVPAVLVNARVSGRTLVRLGRIRAAARLLAGFELIFSQSERDRQRLIALGADPRRVLALGSLKFDLARAEAAAVPVETLRDELGWVPERPVWIAGSTHPGEEEWLLEAHLRLRREHPDLLLILAPRQPQRAREISLLCRARGLTWGLRSRRDPSGAVAVYLLDTLGELASCYPLAQAAFIGGSLVPFGGHNPLEAAAHGVPCCWGPHLDNFREIERLLLDRGCGRVAESGAAVADRIGAWLADQERRAGVRAACERLFAGQGQTAARIVAALGRRFEAAR